MKFLNENTAIILRHPPHQPIAKNLPNSFKKSRKSDVEKLPI